MISSNCYRNVRKMPQILMIIAWHICVTLGLCFSCPIPPPHIPTHPHTPTHILSTHTHHTQSTHHLHTPTTHHPHTPVTLTHTPSTLTHTPSTLTHTHYAIHPHTILAHVHHPHTPFTLTCIPSTLTHTHYAIPLYTPSSHMSTIRPHTYKHAYTQR